MGASRFSCEERLFVRLCPRVGDAMDPAEQGEVAPQLRSAALRLLAACGDVLLCGRVLAEVGRERESECGYSWGTDLKVDSRFA